MTPGTAEYWAAYNDRLAGEFEKNRSLDLRVGYYVQTSNNGGCEVAEDAAAQKRLYGLLQPPSLPLPGCSRGLDCSCALVPQVFDGPQPDPEAVDRRYEEALAKLPPRQASHIRSMIAATLRGFGLRS